MEGVIGMENYDEQTYGERIAEFYDRFYPEVDPAELVLLEELARGREALELVFNVPLPCPGDGDDHSNPKPGSDERCVDRWDWGCHLCHCAVASHLEVLSQV
jgi:hypothetical protein